MDDSRFDQLTKTVATRTSRRNIARGIGAGALVSALGIAGLRGASAQGPSAQLSCKRFEEKCDEDDDCCSNKCRRKKGLFGDNEKSCRCLQKGRKCKYDTACCSGRCKNNDKCA